MLINTAPITVKGGAVGSVVVTMQDLGPLEEQERQRAESAAMAVKRRGGLLTKVLGRHQGDHTRDADQHQAAACIYFAACASQRDVGVVGEHQSSVHA